MSSQTSGRVDWLDSLRGAAIVMVVAMHSASYVSIYETYDGALIYFLINGIGVPVFFLVDGFLFGSILARRQELDYGAYVRRSARRLLLPWAIFSFGYLALRALAEAGGWEGGRTVLGASVRELATMVVMSEVSAQMYFLLSLFLIRCLAPAIRQLSFQRAGVLVGIFVAYSALYRGWLGPAYKAVAPEIGLDPLLHALWGLQFYLLGLSLVKLRPLFSWGRTMLVLGVIAAVLSVWLDPVPRFVGNYGYLFAAVFLFYRLGARAGPLVKMGRETMGIYLLHAPVPIKILSLLAPQLTGDALLQLLLVTFGSLIAALALTLGLRQTRFGPFLFGE